MKAVGAGFWARIALCFLVRSGRATAALSIMVITAVAALIFLSALAVGVKDAMLRNTVGLYSGHITGYNLTDAAMAQDLMIEGVDTVLRRSYLPGVLYGAGLSQPLVICGIDPVMEVKKTALKRKLLEGRYPLSGHGEIMISRNIAQALGVHTGDVLKFKIRRDSSLLDLSVSGIYRTGLDMLDHGIAFIPLDLDPFKNVPLSAAVFLATGIDADPVMQIYNQRFPDTVRFESWETQMPDLRQLIDLEAVSMVIVILLVFGVVAIGIACSFVIFIIRNMREYGILKAMGVTAAEMSVLIVTKVVLMNVIACVAGLLIGLLAVLAVAQMGGIDISAFTSHNRYFAVSGVIQPRLTAFSLWAPPATSLLFSLVAAFWPAALVAREKAANILRMV
jgi:ABC-type lipoprotein release transport system permease subunit